MKVGDIVRIKNKLRDEELIGRISNIKNNGTFKLLLVIKKNEKYYYDSDNESLIIFERDIISYDLTEEEQDKVMAMLI